MTRISVGTSGWNYPDWISTFYPPGAASGLDKLVFLARHFTAVEVRTTFHRPLAVRVMRRWLERLSEIGDFRLLFRVWSDLLFSRVPSLRPRPDSFLETLRPVAECGRLAGVHFLIPAHIEWHPALLPPFQDCLESFRCYPRFVEIGNPGWRRQELADWLHENNIAICQVAGTDEARQAYGQAPGARYPGYLRLLGKTGRIIGPQRLSSTKPSEEGLYSALEIESIAAAISRQSRRRDFFVFTENFSGAAGLVNALQLTAILEGRLPNFPAGLVGDFPILDSLRGDQPSR